MKVSVIVPALNEEEWIGRCLASIAAQPGEYEVFVVDGGSTDRTREIAARESVVLTAPRGRGTQMNAGARAASGDVLLFLHADSFLHPEAFRSLRTALLHPAVVGGTFTLRFDVDRVLLRAYAFFTRFKPRLFHYGDQGIFVRRAVFERLGGFTETPLMEDVDFLRRLRGSGRSVLLSCPVTTSARRFTARGLLRQQALNAALVVLYNLGVPPARLARWYGPQERPSDAASVRGEIPGEPAVGRDTPAQ